MNTDATAADIDGAIPPNAVSVYGQSDAMDEFPVLKAFQQYIDAEQAKSRKRMLAMGFFFVVLMGAVIAVFVSLLIGIEHRNQTLNDRLIEYAMRDRDRLQSASPVVVQQPSPQQDNAAIMMLTAKMDELQNKLRENQEKADKERQQAAVKAPAAQSAPPTAASQELEIAKLKAQLAQEREKAAIEKERRRQAELEEYRRKHYPELYEKPRALARVRQRKVKDIDEDDDVLDDDNAISYFDSDEDEENASEPSKPRTAASRTRKTQGDDVKAKDNSYVIPVEVRGSKSSWKLPE